jgi:8-oxo-dGTP diphosphatase
MSGSVTRVVAAYIEEAGRVLMQRRPLHKARGGLWELPGGKVDAGESDAQALRRELAEELDLTADVGPELGRHEHAYGDLTVLLVVYRATRQGEPRALDGQVIAWLEPAERTALPLCQADRAILAATFGISGP